MERPADVRGPGEIPESCSLLPRTHNEEGVPSAIPPREVTKVALRLKFLIEEVIPCEIDEGRVTRANSPIITKQVQLAAKEAGGEEYGACVIYCLLVCKRWFKRQAILELWDAEMHQVRATACEVLGKLLIEAEGNQDYLLQDMLLKRYSIIRNGEETEPANALERAVDLHALRIIGSAGYQKCISYLWRGWLIQGDGKPYDFVDFKEKDNTDYWVHFHPDRLRAPVYQNAVQVFFSLLYLALYSQVINTINVRGDLDVVEGVLYLFTLGFVCDELSKFWKVGRWYVGFWNVFNCTLYALLTVSFVTRIIALSHRPGEDDGRRHHLNELSYNFLAFSAPMFWIRILLYLDTFRFFGAMLVVMKVMMQESLIFFALLTVIVIGFLQAFIGLDSIDTNRDTTIFILQAMLNSVMQSPDFSGFENFAPPFGIILYYIFTFIVMVILLNILVALYNSAYSDITENATDEYMALFAQKTMQFVRAPDENVFIAPFNLVEIVLLVIPFEWWLPTPQYARLNDLVMATIYSPLLLITAYLESRQAAFVRRNRSIGEADDDTTEEWEQLDGEVDFESEGWRKKCAAAAPNVEVGRAVIEVRELSERVEEVRKLVVGLEEKVARPALVDDPQIRSATLHNPLPLYLHTYVWPFLLIWPAFLAFYLSPERYERHIQSSEWTFVWSGAIITLQSLVWLSTHWNVRLKSVFTSTGAGGVSSAALIRVVPVANAGAAEICPIDRDNVGGKQNISFLFQKRRFLYDPERRAFAPLVYALDADPKPLLETFQHSRGLESAKEVTRLQQHYGDNTFDIPVPTFTELFKEHAVAPFFVFQIFCVGLWLLDEYWYYSLFTLFMLVTFESTVVWQRQRTLNEFRGMSIKPYEIWVHRQGTWQEIQSDKLLPGDLVSVGRTKEDSGVACDMLLIEGSAIVNEAMLSGESTPLLKDSVQLRPSKIPIDSDGMDKNSFVYGGTKVLQITHGNASEESQEVVPVLPSGIKSPPDNGALAVVTKTGFETSQGSLVRTMIYSTERVSANNFEALLFILFLLIFAIAASWYVWQEGVAKDRKRSKLLLDCVLIITSVVPPELPMELSLAVNTSLAALSRYAIYCTEPFRIPFAGRVDIACFDKTGTLTGEDLVVEGIAGLDLGQKSQTSKVEKDGAHSHLTPVLDVDQGTTLVLATAHALVKLDEGDVVGDPMEKATLTSLGWTLGRNDILTSRSGASKGRTHALNAVQIKRRFQFSSALKRQSAVATVTTTDVRTSKRNRSTFVGVKGAPETIRTMLVSTPPHYEETYKYFTRKGSRVLALGYKYLAGDSELGQNRINDLKREDVEGGLVFAGFLVLQCPLKEDAAKAVRMLNESSHRVVMITGDNPLTAVHVAREVEIVDREVLILDAPENDTSGEKLVWRSIDEKVNTPVDPSETLDAEILKTKDLCITGYALAKYKHEKALPDLLRHTWVYARVSPKQKEEILTGLKDAGYTTLMCGDGTNDVGALKQAHIGVALLNGSQEALTKIGEHWRMTKMKEVYEKQIQLMARFKQPAPPVPAQIAHLYPPGPQNPHHEAAILREAEKKAAAGAVAASSDARDKKSDIPTISSPGAQALQQANSDASPDQQRKMNAQKAAAGLADKLTSSMMEAELDENEPPTIKLGDASVAAPFTSKLANVVAIPNIIRQGRCTLVATIQMYKILALNCLISAYSLSVLYLEGIKFGDGQVTISGMMMSVCFLSISRAKPMEQLSKERPQSNIFNPYIIGSVLGQFAIHIATLIYISGYVHQIEPRSDDIDLEGEFEPSLLNSAVYLLQLIQQISTFAINYQGRPFRESIRENRGMFWGLVLVSAVAFSCSTEFIPEINQKLKLVPFTPAFKLTMTTLMVLDFAGCWLVETVLKHLFSDFRPKDIALRRPDQLEREARRAAEEAETSGAVAKV
ncbi:MAG: hypothetical protein M1832_004026 [Thelocarpon impressellum]|nr:MAG: hypothetical protein M1832_004026 [Thelocarpon impressellum]